MYATSQCIHLRKNKIKTGLGLLNPNEMKQMRLALLLKHIIYQKNLHFASSPELVHNTDVLLALKSTAGQRY